MVRLYCRDNLPSRKWVQGRSTSLTVRGDEFCFTDCWLVEREPESTERGTDLSPLHLGAIVLRESLLVYTAAGFTGD